MSEVLIHYYYTRNTNNVPTFKVKDNFQNSFFPSAVNEWNKLDQKICNSESLNIFQKSLKVHASFWKQISIAIIPK